MSEEKKEIPVVEMEMPETLNDSQALVVLINATRVAQQKGIYSLEEAELISKAIRHFSTPRPEGPETSA